MWLLWESWERMENSHHIQRVILCSKLFPENGRLRGINHHYFLGAQCSSWIQVKFNSANMLCFRYLWDPPPKYRWQAGGWLYESEIQEISSKLEIYIWKFSALHRLNTTVTRGLDETTEETVSKEKRVQDGDQKNYNHKDQAEEGLAMERHSHEVEN